MLRSLVLGGAAIGVHSFASTPDAHAAVDCIYEFMKVKSSACGYADLVGVITSETQDTLYGFFDEADAYVTDPHMTSAEAPSTSCAAFSVSM